MLLIFFGFFVKLGKNKEEKEKSKAFGVKLRVKIGTNICICMASGLVSTKISAKKRERISYGKAWRKHQEAEG